MKLIRCSIVAIVALISCTYPVCGCSPPPNAAVVVWGQVITDSGAPASGAAIMAAISEPNTACTQGHEQPIGTADSAGRYRIKLWTFTEDSSCVFISTRFPARSTPASYAMLGPFKLSFRYNEPFDSVLVNFELVTPTAAPRP